MINIGFEVSKTDTSLYGKRIDGYIVFILIYVDDLIIGGHSIVEINKLKKNLEKQFHMKGLGELKYFLGIEMVRYRKGIVMLQKQY